MDKISNLENRLEKVEFRNKDVELNKAWETSITRKLLIALFTYIAIGGYMKFVLGINPWINALVPTTGFLLSTLTFPFFKNLWSKHLYKKR